MTRYIVALEFSGEVIAHLLQLYSRLPRARLFPCIYGFESSGRRLAFLPSSAQTITVAVAAIGSRIPLHPVLFGPVPPPPPSYIPDYPHACRIDTHVRIREAETGCVREVDGHGARARAEGKGSQHIDSDEAIAACSLLQFLERLGFDDFLNSESSTFVFFTSMRSMMSWSPPDSKMFQDPEPFSFVSTTLAPPPRAPALLGLHGSNPPPENIPGLEEMRLRWSMQPDAITSVWQEQVCDYTLQDEALLCGPPPPSLRRKSVLPFSFTRFAEHLDDLTHIGKQPGPARLMRNILDRMRGALGSVNIPLYKDLQERVAAARTAHAESDERDVPKLEAIIRTFTRTLVPWSLCTMRKNRSTNAVDGVIKRIEEHYVSREDWNTIIELGAGKDKGELVLRKIPAAMNMTLSQVQLYRTPDPVPQGDRTWARCRRSCLAAHAGSEEAFDVSEEDGVSGGELVRCAGAKGNLKGTNNWIAAQGAFTLKDIGCM
ncbi:hypothetical protein CONPUDRAFT_75435 [Coniophora puteana RWD-64-598 SS2]|uniref:Uncharacterized protein n=1 Tax=Coniophora puteana (strain RWD-64-598) TaxID=741705 RepID=A0A5M3MEK7_CONPW|nr:uncharacterized protein CONPUDRAFT_75435 [Coniophora puteana RWD-64-598 SS2]EIW77583.1 hypothetical protein CONPUDRAFT_75435 [Coniophora puteana RWD-64-598 SS2]